MIIAYEMSCTLATCSQRVFRCGKLVGEFAKLSWHHVLGRAHATKHEMLWKIPTHKTKTSYALVSSAQSKSNSKHFRCNHVHTHTWPLLHENLIPPFCINKYSTQSLLTGMWPPARRRRKRCASSALPSWAATAEASWPSRFFKATSAPKLRSLVIASMSLTFNILYTLKSEL